MDFDALIPFVVSLFSRFPIFFTIVSILGTSRLIMKPIMVCLRAVAGATPSKNDDVWVDRIEQSKFYTTLCFILDYVLSIKLPAQTKESTVSYDDKSVVSKDSEKKV